jgi:segregation and condensation protein B
MNSSLQNSIEAVLFYKNEPVSISYLSKILDSTTEEIELSLKLLEETLENRGISLIRADSSVSLTTSKTQSQVIEKIVKTELKDEISKAGLETLSIILYNQKVTRREIDYIRGVNSSYILRNLSMRGLIEKTDSNSSERGLHYKPTVELLAHLGVTSLQDLPEFDTVQNEITSIKHGYSADEAK